MKGNLKGTKKVTKFMGNVITGEIVRSRDDVMVTRCVWVGRRFDSHMECRYRCLIHGTTRLECSLGGDRAHIGETFE